MGIFYNAAMYMMSFGIRVAGLFNSKARKWSRGRRKLLSKIRESVDPGSDIAWFHAASLGEFEQARPVIEAFRSKFPGYKILVTFFSPSGYEVRKDYPGADYIFYLPADTKWNAKRFVSIVNPKVAVFIKYEFWANYLKCLKGSGTRIYIVSAIFRRNSAFFKWYGTGYRKLLGYFDHLFVQDKASKVLLRSIHVSNVTVAGDTRFDRVLQVVGNAKVLPYVEAFAKDAIVLVAGSTWGQDEELLLELMGKRPDVKFIIAPHEIEEGRIRRLMASTSRKSVRYTVIDSGSDLYSAEIMIIDTIGILSSVYRYGNYAYIGGGFGVGIHNILEAAAYGLPLAFGPNYSKFKEANDLIVLGGASSVIDSAELEEWFSILSGSSVEYDLAAVRCRDYVRNGAGATETIISAIQQDEA